jgi:hypothetical protein
MQTRFIKPRDSFERWVVEYMADYRMRSYMRLCRKLVRHSKIARRSLSAARP